MAGCGVVSWEERSRFFAMVKSGVPVAVASSGVGVTRTTGYRWIRDDEAVVSVPADWNPGGRALTLADREEVMIGRELGETLTQIGARIGRDKSVVSRELARNSNKNGSYRAVTAHRRAFRRSRRPKTRKLLVHPMLWGYVCARLRRYWSPQQISAKLVLEFPDDLEMRVSHETIYQSLYVQAKSELKKELTGLLRQQHTRRKPHGRVPRRGARHLLDRVMISERPAEIADRAVPGHWEGDLIMGARNQSAIGTLVERATRHTLLLHLPRCRNLEGVRDAMIEAITALPEVMRRTVTWDQGIEMGLHSQIAVATDIDIYFCDPHSPWQRGTNENTNGLLRQYFPKGTDLSVFTKTDLQRIQDEFNDRPRQTLSWRTPTEAFNELVASTT